MSPWRFFFPLYSVPHFEGRQCPFIDLLGGKGEFFLVDPYTKDVALLGYQVYMYVYSGVVPARFSTLADLWLCIQLSDPGRLLK